MGEALAVACVALLVAALAMWRVILRDREMGELVEAYEILEARYDRLRRFVAQNTLWAEPEQTDQEVERSPR